MCAEFSRLSQILALTGLRSTAALAHPALAALAHPCASYAIADKAALSSSRLRTVQQRHGPGQAEGVDAGRRVGVDSAGLHRHPSAGIDDRADSVVRGANHVQAHLDAAEQRHGKVLMRGDIGAEARVAVERHQQVRPQRRQGAHEQQAKEKQEKEKEASAKPPADPAEPKSPEGDSTVTSVEEEEESDDDSTDEEAGADDDAATSGNDESAGADLDGDVSDGSMDNSDASEGGDGTTDESDEAAEGPSKDTAKSA